jgi:selenide,water dikinase
MLSHGGVGARVHLAAVPVLEGVRELAGEGHVPGGTRRNKESLDADVTYDPGISEQDRLLLCDAQTSGGLLFAVAAATASELVAHLHAAGVPAVEVGEFVGAPAGRIEVLP